MDFLKKLFGGSDAGNDVSPSPVRRAGVIDAPGLADKLKLPQPPFLLDVREAYEYADSHIAGAKLIPLGELPKRLHELPRDREIVCVCQSGSRSSVATRQLLANGYAVTNLNRGMIGWSLHRLPTHSAARRR
jgi:rhodanese-related sulfurtransferase